MAAGTVDPNKGLETKNKGKIVLAGKSSQIIPKAQKRYLRKPKQL